MRLEFESDTLTLPFTETEVIENTLAEGSTRAQEFLRAGIKAAQTGNRAQARQYLLRVTETEPDNENAWLWLASISEYPEELLIFLNNVLEVNPTNERALEWLKATNSLLAVTFVQRGIDAAKTTRNDFAKQCFYQALAYDAKNESAWLWLAFVSGSAEEKRTNLEKVLRINPANEAARAALKDVQTEAAQSLLKKAAASADDRPAAAAMLAEVLQKCPEMTEAWMLKADLTDDASEKIECFEKILAVNPAHEAARTSLNSLVAAMRKDEAQSESEVFQVEEKNSLVAADTDFVEENLFEENAPHGQTETDDYATEFQYTRILDDDEHLAAQSNENIYLAAENESEPVKDARRSEKTGDENGDENGEKISQATKEFSFEKESFFAAETKAAEEVFAAAAEDQTANFEGDVNFEAAESQFEKSADNLALYSAPEEVSAPSYNYELETDASVSEYVVEESSAAENHMTGNHPAENDSKAGVFQTADYSNEYELEEVVNNASPEYPGTAETIEPEYEEKYGFAPVDAPTADEFSRLAEDVSPNDFQPESDMLEVENYHSNNNHSAAFDSNENSDLIELEETEDVAENFADDSIHQTASNRLTEFAACPFCSSENNAQAFDCRTCRAVLSLSDLEMLLANQNLDAETLGQAVERMERVKNLADFGEKELLDLGIGHLNLKNFRHGFSYLQKALQANPNDVLLSSQVNALAIRLEEIERHEEVHDAMMKGKKILVVDDSPTVRKLISGKLEKSGHEVVCAVDGMDALAKLNEAAPDLILLDINMPKMDGYQVCKMIRSNPLTKDIPVVMISGKDGFFDKVRGRMAGTTGYITKPFGPETLMKALDVYIKAGGETNFSSEESEVLMEV